MPKPPTTIPNLIKSTRAVYNSVPSLSPTNNVICNYEIIENLDVIDDICADAHQGFLDWSRKSFADRSEIIRSAASLVKKNKEQYVDAHMAIGANRPFAEFIADLAHQNILEHALSISQPEGEVVKSVKSQLALSVRTPVGPVLSIAPWNAPTVLWARAMAAPLSAGCSVVAKALEKSPISSFLLAKDFHEAGVDTGALQVCQFSSQDQAEATQKLIENQRIKKVNFTGSTSLGAKISGIAGRSLKPALLELGGKNAFIVTEKADLHKAAESLLFSAWVHNGQICMCLDSCYVQSSIYDEFVEVLMKKVKEQRLEVTPLRDSAGAEKVNVLVSDAVNKGAKIVFQAQLSLKDAFYPPTILAGVDSSMKIYSEETFGPVLSLFKFNSMDDVISELNDLEYGLKTSIWSSDVMEAMNYARRLNSGGVHINSSTIHDEATLPHGGVGQSGSGRFNAKWGVENFSFDKVITANP